MQYASNIEKFKPFLRDFIKFYYEDLENGAGGYLHIVLDDGNVGFNDIEFSLDLAEKNGDSFGVFLARLLKEFTENELDEMYENDWWGMDK
jgi:hypothetical protein